MTNQNIFKGKNAFVTGATGAIGGAIAADIAAAGANLILVGSKQSDLIDKKNKIINAQISINLIEADLSKHDDILDTIDQVKAIGGVDIVINSAGIFPNKSIHEMTFSEYRDVMNINLNSAYMFSAALSELMKNNRWGRIVNIGSSSAYAGFKNTIAYCVSKHGLLGLSRALHDELKEFGIRVYCVSPSSTQGKMGMVTTGQDYSTFLDPQDVSDYVMFVMSCNGNAISEEIYIKRMFVR